MADFDIRVHIAQMNAGSKFEGVIYNTRANPQGNVVKNYQEKKAPVRQTAGINPISVKGAPVQKTPFTPRSNPQHGPSGIFVKEKQNFTKQDRQAPPVSPRSYTQQGPSGSFVKEKQNVTNQDRQAPVSPRSDPQHSSGGSFEVRQENTKRDKPCFYWTTEGYCKNGNNCLFKHPLKKLELEDILKYEKSPLQNPNQNDGIFTKRPDLPGLPDLPPNGKCRVTSDQGLIIYFIPFYKPIDGIVYYKKIRLYRLNKSKGIYKLVFSYTKLGFHITTAAASNGYLVCSRLPYDEAVLKLMEEAKKLKNQNTQWQLKDEKHMKEIEKLKKKNRYLSDKVKRKPVSELRVNVGIRVEQDLRLEILNKRVLDNIRLADPVDLFVYDPLIKAHVHVLEYHKPADHVSLKGRTLQLWDKQTGKNHTFFIVMKTDNVIKFNLDDPLQPKKLCDVF
jgi:hypothetical protein